jgi:hypothetical protein
MMWVVKKEHHQMLLLVNFEKKIDWLNWEFLFTII